MSSTSPAAYPKLGVARLMSTRGSKNLKITSETLWVDLLLPITSL
jgi:hypothetical protein